MPVLVAVLICDAAVADPSSGKKNLIGIFDQLNVARFPTQWPVTIYMKLTDAEGFYKMEVRYVQVSSGQVLAKAELESQFTSRLVSADLFVPFPPLPVPSEGRYEFQIWANEVYLGGTFMNAVQRKTQG